MTNQTKMQTNSIQLRALLVFSVCWGFTIACMTEEIRPKCGDHYRDDSLTTWNFDMIKTKLKVLDVPFRGVVNTLKFTFDNLPMRVRCIRNKIAKRKELYNFQCNFTVSSIKVEFHLAPQYPFSRPEISQIFMVPLQINGEIVYSGGRIGLQLQSFRLPEAMELYLTDEWARYCKKPQFCIKNHFGHRIQKEIEDTLPLTRDITCD